MSARDRVLAEEIDAERKAKAEARMSPEARKLEKRRRARQEEGQQKRRAEWDARTKARREADEWLVTVLIDIAGDRLPELLAALDGSVFAGLRHTLEAQSGIYSQTTPK